MAMPTVHLKKKFNIIFSREESMARSVALAAIKPKPFSVWEVLIPILFIFGYMRSKEQREAFAQNLLFTKKMALEAAFDMLKKDLSKDDALHQLDVKTRELLVSMPEGVYSEEIRREQMSEIELLIDHYSKLLTAEGHDYEALIARVYKTTDNYLAFLEGLRETESAVALAAKNTLGPEADTRMLERIEAATQKIRAKQVARIF